MGPTKSLSRQLPRSVFKGLALTFLSGIFYSLSAIIVKYMKNLHPGQLAVYRFCSIFLFSWPDIVKSGKNPMGPPSMRRLLLIRGLIGATNIYLNFMAFRYLPLGEATVILFSTPILVVIMARIFLKEPCGYTETMIAILTAVGLLLIARVPEILTSSEMRYTNETVLGLSAAFLSLFFNSCRFIILRKLKSVHYAVTMFNYGWVGIIECCILTFITAEFQWHKCGLDQWLMVGLAFFSYFAQSSITVALQIEFAGPVSTVAAAVEIILAFIFQATLFEEVPDEMSILGALLVGVCIVVVGLKKVVITLPKNSVLKNKLKFLTF